MKRGELPSLNTSGTVPTSRGATPASPLRCLAVWVALTTVAMAGTLLGVAAVVDTLPATATSPTTTGDITVDQALVVGAGVGAAAVCPWLWFLATLSVAEAVGGRVSARTGWTRRLTLLACGVAVTTSALSPAHAAIDAPQPLGPAGTISLDGLPYPDRPSGSTARAAQTQTDDLPLRISTPSAAAPDGAPGGASGATYRVKEGDTLWTIAATSTASTDLPRAVAELHLRNRRVIGADPDLIHPGQVLDLHSEGDEPR